MLRICHFSNNKIVISDYEKYYTLFNSEMAASNGFSTDRFKNAFDIVKYKEIFKFKHKTSL